MAEEYPTQAIGSDPIPWSLIPVPKSLVPG